MPSDTDAPSRGSGYSRWNPNTWELWERNQWAIYTAVLISFLSFTFVMPFLPQFVQELGIHDPAKAALWSGLLFGISPLLGGLLTPFWVSVAQRTGNKPMVMRSLVSYVVLISLMGVCTNIWQLLALRILLGVFSGFSAFAIAVLSVTVPKERVSQSIGTLQSVQFAASAIGPIFGGTMADTIGLRNTFYVSAFFSVLAALAFHWLFNAAHDRASAPQRRERASIAILAHLPGFLAIMITLFAVNFIERTFGPLIPLYVKQLHAPTDFVATISGAVVTLGSLTAAVAAMAMGRLSRVRDPRNLLLLTLSLGSVILIPITIAQEWWHLIIFRPILTLFIGGNTTLCYAIAARALPAQWKVTAFGALGGLAMIGGASASFVAGAVTDLTHSLRTIFGLDAVLYTGLVILAWRFIRLPDEEPTPAPIVTTPRGAVGGAPGDG